MSSHIQIRKATPDDVTSILEMVRELAVFEELEDALVASEADYQTSLFGETPVAEALVAEDTATGGLVGYAIFFSTFSSFIGRAGIWLEDIYVRPDFRSLGAGKALLAKVAEIARERNAGRFEWCVLDWNQNAIDFYQRAGATILKEWRIVRVEGDQLESLADRKT